MSHEERLDIPAIAAALERRARYIGAIGAKRTQERRLAALSEQGFSDAELARIHGPAGLDLGGRAPAQVALAIAAEIVAVTSGGLKKDKAAVAAERRRPLRTTARRRAAEAAAEPVVAAEAAEGAVDEVR